MDAKNNIVLIGPMGSGKTTVGQALAQRLGWDFFDTDQLIVDRCGLEIPEIFSQKGEAYFRRVEEAVISETVLKDRSVIATGGGAVTVSTNLKNMRENGVVIYLKTSLDELVKRVGDDNGRPLLSGKDRTQVLRSLLAGREELYSQGDLVIETDGLEPPEITEEIIRRICRRNI